MVHPEVYGQFFGTDEIINNSNDGISEQSNSKEKLFFFFGLEVPFFIEKMLYGARGPPSLLLRHAAKFSKIAKFLIF